MDEGRGLCYTGLGRGGDGVGLREMGKRPRERGQEYLSQRDKGLPPDREETDVAHRQITVKWENSVLG